MDNKRKADVISISSDDDDDDDVPLKLLATPSHVITEKDLKSYSVQTCEFCDKVFYNRYDILVHNTRHIIIPLLKKSNHQCSECLLYFISKKELKSHIKHIHKAKGNRDSIKNLHEIDIDKEKPELILKDFTINLVDLKHMKNEEKNEDRKTEKTNESNSIISRLTFEEEYLSDCAEVVDTDVNLINDLTTECQVQLNLFDDLWVDDEKEVSKEVNNETSKDETQTTGNSILRGLLVRANIITPEVPSDTSTGSSEDEDEVVGTSTHFDDLVKPGLYRCKRCQELFATRFQLIQHDMSHIRISKPRPILCEFCERYISNSRFLFRRHLTTHAPDLWRHKQRPHAPCGKCGLKYFNYKRHVQNYHELVYCHLCYKGFDSNAERLDHIREHLRETKCSECDLVSTAVEIEEHQRVYHRVSSVSTLQICKTCSYFVKNKKNMTYKFLRTISEVGTRLTCQRCNKQYFELKLVKRLHRTTLKEPVDREKKKGLTNTDRLKNIQQRLKMINKLSRFYAVVLFLSCVGIE